ncbi:Jag family protein [Cellulomonas xiejunii]|uniref:Single-stranded DNA-binding protein n=1 Tax=Cellulomonas xiejunii TaxID=2968083 RepID=A0ABY5KN12_9CELL|nr:R3H domain-containing nucleic acid-binding protein [Cellulomonas xiejunii]MCC2313516.1 single-stranded DNA-binding protein [Cellulomonas xiejunii]MCC2321310.1 single-stranded DNA-binding protein [Cellulomonas xiejunii]UUI71897.1 single-stranded DNA-binding protein [Cellulomonas xiejunii]
MATSDPGTAVDGDLVTRLEEEGEIAADYLEEFLDIADLDGDIDIDVDHGRAAVEIVAEDAADDSLRRLVGQDGQVLDALQELTRLAVQTKTGERSRLMLDVAGFRAARRKELVGIASEAIERVKTGQAAAVTLAPMNPFERKVVHDAVAEAGLVSDSEGVEPERRVVIRAV